MTNPKLALVALVITSNTMATPPVPKVENLNITTYSTYTCIDGSGKTDRLDFTRQSNIVRHADMISWNFEDNRPLDIREVHYFKSLHTQTPSGESDGKPYYTIGNGADWIHNCELKQPRTGEKIIEPQYVPEPVTEYAYETYTCKSKSNKTLILNYVRVIRGNAKPYFYWGEKLTYANKTPVQGRYLIEYKSIIENKPNKGIYTVGSPILKWDIKTCKKTSTRKGK